MKLIPLQRSTTHQRFYSKKIRINDDHAYGYEDHATTNRVGQVDEYFRHP